MGNGAMVDATELTFSRFVGGAPGRPFIVAQLGQSLDGRIATRTGDSRYIGHAPSLLHLHRLRARVDAVVVGIGTVLADDPQLTVRRCAGRNPARIIVDARALLPGAARCLAADGTRRIVFHGAHLPPPTVPDGVEIHTLPVGAEGRFDLVALAACWRDLGFGSVLIEGGAALISAAIDAGIVDRLHLMVSPVILGSGRSGLDLRPIDRLAEAIRPATEIYPLGEGEVLYDCALLQAE